MDLTPQMLQAARDANAPRGAHHSLLASLTRCWQSIQTTVMMLSNTTNTIDRTLVPARPQPETSGVAPSTQPRVALESPDDEPASTAQHCTDEAGKGTADSPEEQPARLEQASLTPRRERGAREKRIALELLALEQAANCSTPLRAQIEATETTPDQGSPQEAGADLQLALAEGSLEHTVWHLPGVVTAPLEALREQGARSLGALAFTSLGEGTRMWQGLFSQPAAPSTASSTPLMSHGAPEQPGARAVPFSVHRTWGLKGSHSAQPHRGIKVPDPAVAWSWREGCIADAKAIAAARCWNRVRTEPAIRATFSRMRDSFARDRPDAKPPVSPMSAHGEVSSDVRDRSNSPLFFPAHPEPASSSEVEDTDTDATPTSTNEESRDSSPKRLERLQSEIVAELRDQNPERFHRAANPDRLGDLLWRDAMAEKTGPAAAVGGEAASVQIEAVPWYNLRQHLNATTSVQLHEQSKQAYHFTAEHDHSNRRKERPLWSQPECTETKSSQVRGMMGVGKEEAGNAANSEDLRLQMEGKIVRNVYEALSLSAREALLLQGAGRSAASLEELLMTLIFPRNLVERTVIVEAAGAMQRDDDVFESMRARLGVSNPAQVRRLKAEMLALNTLERHHKLEAVSEAEGKISEQHIFQYRGKNWKPPKKTAKGTMAGGVSKDNSVAAEQAIVYERMCKAAVASRMQVREREREFLATREQRNLPHRGTAEERSREEQQMLCRRKIEVGEACDCDDCMRYVAQLKAQYVTLGLLPELEEKVPPI